MKNKIKTTAERKKDEETERYIVSLPEEQDQESNFCFYS
jgi:hypothetical protein